MDLNLNTVMKNKDFVRKYVRKQALKPESAIKKSDKIPYPASTSGLKLPVFFIAFLSALLTFLLLEGKSR